MQRERVPDFGRPTYAEGRQRALAAGRSYANQSMSLDRLLQLVLEIDLKRCLNCGGGEPGPAPITEPGRYWASCCHNAVDIGVNADATPFVRNLATRRVTRCVDRLIKQMPTGECEANLIRIKEGRVQFTEFEHFSRLVDTVHPRPTQQQCLGLRGIADVLARNEDARWCEFTLAQAGSAYANGRELSQIKPQFLVQGQPIVHMHSVGIYGFAYSWAWGCIPQSQGSRRPGHPVPISGSWPDQF